MYTYLSSHVYIIRYTNKSYVLFQMLQVSLQHCCWASYQIAEQVTIVNLVALCGSWGIVLDNDLESGPGEGTHFRNTTYAPPFWPPFFRSVESLFSFDPNIWAKNEENVVFRPLFVKTWQNVLFRSPLFALCSNVSHGAVLSIPIRNPTETPTPSPGMSGGWGWG